jgi:hypothetical protein
MVFATVCIGEDRRSDTMHLLHDLRNLDYKVFLYTNIDFDFERFQFSNVHVIKTEEKVWNDFQRFIPIKTAFELTNDEFVYYLDCDSRFFNFRDEKFDKNKFEQLLVSKNFDIMSPHELDPVITQLNPPNPNEDKNIRQYHFGFESVIQYLKSKNLNYDNDVLRGSPLETVLLFRKSDKMILFLEELLNFSKLLIHEEEKIGRKHVAPGCGFAMRLLSGVYGLNIVINGIVCHFFKGNFLREVFPFNFKIWKEEKIF